MLTYSASFLSFQLIPSRSLLLVIFLSQTVFVPRGFSPHDSSLVVLRSCPSTLSLFAPSVQRYRVFLSSPPLFLSSFLLSSLSSSLHYISAALHDLLSTHIIRL